MSDYAFLSKWFSDMDDCLAMKKHITWFLDQFPPNIRPLVLKLLCFYEYYDEEKQESLFNVYVKHVIKYVIDNNISDYVITMPFDSGSHSSYLVATLFKGIPLPNNGIFESRLTDIELGLYKEIIYIDDYSGTGNKFIKYLRNKNKCIKCGTNIYFFPCFLTRTSLNNISTNKTIKKVVLSNVVSNIRTTDFLRSCHILNYHEVDQIVNYSSKKIRVDSGFVRGYGDTEDLFSLNYMTPNNTIGLFWWDRNSLYYPLFLRNTSGQRNSIRHPRFKYDFIRLYNDSFLKSPSKKMRTYLIIAVLLIMGNSADDVKKQCNFSDFSYNEGVRYLKNQKVLSEILSVNVGLVKTLIKLDNLIIFVNTGNEYNSYSHIRRNLISTIQ